MDSAEVCYLLATKLKVEIVRCTLYCNCFLLSGNIIHVCKCAWKTENIIFIKQSGMYAPALHVFLESDT